MNAFLIPDNFVLRTDMKLEELATYRIPLDNFRVHDAVSSLLPATAANDDLGMITGTLGTSRTSLRTSDSKAASTTQYGRTQIILPPEYQAGETVQLVLKCDMETTVADTSAAVDVTAYINGTGSDICATAAQSMNALLASDKTFVLTATNLEPGSLIDVRVSIAIVDGATGTAVIGQITQCDLQCDIRG